MCLLQAMDLDRKVRRGQERLAQEVDLPLTGPISAEKSEQLSVLEEKIKKLLEQIETLGEAGKVDEAEALMRKVQRKDLPHQILFYAFHSKAKFNTGQLNRWIC